MAFSLFTLVFLGLVIAVFFLVRRDLRPIVLLLASFLYIIHLDKRAFVSVIVCTILVYASGILIQYLMDKEKEKTASVISFACLLLMVALLATLKFTSLIIPIGFSYYMFQAMGYLIDIQKGRTKAQRNIIFFALYMCYFPKFVSGPIEREAEFSTRLQKLKEVKFRNERRMSEAFGYILYGYFMKLVVSDNLGRFVPKLFGEFGQHGSLWLLLGSLSYTMQLYCDFAGYSALAVGVSKIFGIDLMQNFTAPYMSVGISDFWRRWHRSLSFWLRDYVYIPFGGNRKGKPRQCLNIMIVFILCGIWHGNTLNFLVWGLLHGVCSVIGILAKDKYTDGANKYITGVRRVITFCFVSFAWIFFGANGLKNAIDYIVAMLTAGNAGTSFLAEYNAMAIGNIRSIFLMVFLVMVVIMDIVSYKKDKPFPAVIQDSRSVVRYLVFYLMILAIFVFGVYGQGYDAGKFMYMNF